MDGNLTGRIAELIRRTTTQLPIDVERALGLAHDQEDKDSTAQKVLRNILDNVQMARDGSTPICQDTGAMLFEVDLPRGTDDRPVVAAIEQAARDATSRHLLRPNAVNPLTGKNTGDNVGTNAPVIHLHLIDGPALRVRLMLKGGGSENVCAQFRLPDGPLGAGRDLAGVRKVVLKAIFDAQGKGCSPGVIGVGLGGDRTTGYQLAKAQLFRRIGERSVEPELAELEVGLLADANALGIGPMGLGGKTTALDVFVGWQHRHPATYYVSIAYMCWACRRGAMTVNDGEVAYD